jgi:lysophospholipase L1-like esterase
MSTPVYLALGDSMSIDLYPVLDLRDRERIPGNAWPAAGAASLLHRNDDELWPEFRERDLATRQPALRILNTCMDGATIGHTADFQLLRIDDRLDAAVRVVTLTAGGNDLLGGVFADIDGLERVVDVSIRRYGDLVERIARRFSAATIVLTTVYDPTDGTGQLPGVSELVGALPVQLLDTFNDAVRELAAGSDRCLLADVHHHFLGHGLPAAEHDRWYWNTSPIEPGARGASEIRRVWLNALDHAYPWKGL